MNKLSLAALGLFCFGMNAYAASSSMSVNNFKQIQSVVLNLKDPAHTLLVLDDDDTLTMMPCANPNNPKTCQYIGGPAWWAWQEHLPKHSPYKVAKKFDGLMQNATTLMALNKMTYTDPKIPAVLANLASKGVHVVIETARGQGMSSATQEQLSYLTIKINGAQSSMSKFFNQYGLTGANNLKSLASPYSPCNNKHARLVRYEQGVYYVAGQNKGVMLHCLLNRTHSAFIKNIVFADDKYQNIADMGRTFKHSKLNVVSLYYTRLEKHKAALTSGKLAQSYQTRARQAWMGIHNALKHSLGKPEISN